jgi:hypothetical protein
MTSYLSIDNGNEYVDVASIADSDLASIEERVVNLLSAEECDAIHGMTDSVRDWIELACNQHHTAHGAWPIV